jgi:hypothetical protein
MLSDNSEPVPAIPINDDQRIMSMATVAAKISISFFPGAIYTP